MYQFVYNDVELLERAERAYHSKCRHVRKDFKIFYDARQPFQTAIVRRGVVKLLTYHWCARAAPGWHALNAEFRSDSKLGSLMYVADVNGNVSDEIREIADIHMSDCPTLR